VRVIVMVLIVLGSRAAADPVMWEVPEGGGLAARMTVEADLGKHSSLQPLSVAPDLVVGIDGRWGVMLQNSSASYGELGAGNGLCVIGPRETLGEMEPTCLDRASGIGLAALVRVTPGLTARGGVVMRGSDAPLRLAAMVGLVTMHTRGRWWVLGAPVIVSGITAREAGNRERLHVPLYAGVNIARAELHLRSGIDGTLQTFDETFAIPLGIGGSVDIRGVRVGVDAKLDKAFGPLNAMSWRSASLYIEMGTP
jgi:hypothetical protein